MSSEANKAIIRRLVQEALNQGNLNVLDELFDPAFVEHSSPDQPTGPDGVKQFVSIVRAGFPDLQVTVSHLIAEGDEVVVRTIWQGTHQGAYAGMPPTGKQVSRTLIHIFRIRNGKITDEWNEGAELL
jgi:steroid delta-isomerase-like uncharacterized protein